ncbi:MULTISPECIES: sigma-70 family RNA polymerase sigma factor [unclassified Brevibacterium]|uniref:sigma-70 family RNA polymerase sigma factor n=1 Tax=unclassified Brevibacterium TaxID=2614124 RepID=UPI0020182990|nr:sigma-70 family RNA polymerase sigma factor [Brevibacterium sp. 2SA]MCM1012973.1 sigma-70 family RNA polymerase sigma factor [Brevibacterium sp. XM4083]
MDVTHSESPAARAWDESRGRLFGIAYRMLGDVGHAEDVVSEVGIAAVVAEREAASEIRSWPAWLTTVGTRKAIDRARHLASIKEDYPGPWLPEPIATEALPEEALANRELLSLTLLHLADQLSPESRAALVLSRAFDLPAEEIGEILGKSAAAVRQLVSRAARRLDLDRDVSRPADPAALGRLAEAIHSGDLAAALPLLLAEDAVYWSDGGGKVRSAVNPVFGSARIARFFAGVLTPVDLDGAHIGAILEINGGLAMAIRRDGDTRVLEIDLGADGLIHGLRQVNNPDKLTRLGGGGRRPTGG